MVECTPAHEHARQYLHETLMRYPTEVGDPRRLWLPRPLRFGKADRTLVKEWKFYLRWEESDSLGFGNEHRVAFINRVNNAYRKAVVSMRFFPEIWYMAFLWTRGAGSLDMSTRVLREGIRANPTSFVLNFAYAEVLELQGADHRQLVRETYDTLLRRLREDIVSLESSIGDVVGVSGDFGCSVGVGASSAPELGVAGVHDRTTIEVDLRRRDLLDRCREYGVVWIVYMRFVRRVEGQEACRDTFATARLDKFTPWQVYVAAAQWEYHSTNDPSIATHIYQMGMDVFGTDGTFAARYLDFLLSVNDLRSEYVAIPCNQCADFVRCRCSVCCSVADAGGGRGASFVGSVDPLSVSARRPGDCDVAGEGDGSLSSRWCVLAPFLYVTSLTHFVTRSFRSALCSSVCL